MDGLGLHTGRLAAPARVPTGRVEHAPSATGRSVPAVPIKVECTNCGGDEWITYFSLGVAVASVILALVAAYLARKAVKVADDTLKVAHEDAGRSRTEHAEFMRQLQARARFDVTLTPKWPANADGLIEQNATSTRVTVAIGISNEQGDKAAGPTTVNALVPEGMVSDLRWSGPQGEEVSGVSRMILTTPEILTDADGSDYEAQYLFHELPRVTRRTARLLHLTFYVEIPSKGERSVPIRVRVESDDLPDDDPEVVRELMIRVRPASST